MNWFGNCWWAAPVFCLLACCGEGTEGDEILQLNPDAPTVELDIQPSEVETIPMGTGRIQNRTDVDNEHRRYARPIGSTCVRLFDWNLRLIATSISESSIFQCAIDSV